MTCFLGPDFSDKAIRQTAKGALMRNRGRRTLQPLQASQRLSQLHKGKEDLAGPSPAGCVPESSETGKEPQQSVHNSHRIPHHKVILADLSAIIHLR